MGLAALAGPAASRAEAAAPSSPRVELVELAGAAALAARAAQEFLRFAVPPLAARDATLAASDAPFAYGFARTAAELCAASRRDCDKFPKIAECATLAAAAAACEAACRKAAG
ncbi:MAG TPA: hypothetical protein VMJ31_06560 [Methylocystis sp.]|nr:hypothetical protein [Methylocystis sp.]